MTFEKAARFFQPWVNRIIATVVAAATTAGVALSVTAVHRWRQAEQRACEAELRASIGPELRHGVVRQTNWCATLAQIQR